MRTFLTLLIMALALGCSDDTVRNDTVRWSGYPDYGSSYLDTGGGNSCGPSTCGGCCQGTTCMSVTTAQACGYGGLACKQCQSGESCQAGVCTPSTTKCDATSCGSGCCDLSGKCVSGTADTSCGKGGAACSQCTSKEQCKEGLCKTKALAKYKVTLVSAKVAGCGWTDTCDAFVILKVGSSTKTSATKDDTASPIWNELMLTETETDLLKSFAVEVFDKDLYFDDTIGKCTPSITKSVLSAGKLVTNCGTNIKALTFEFKQ